MVIKHYVLKFRFLEDYCEYQEHWCNGKHIPDIDSKGDDRNIAVPDKIACIYYDPKKKKCRHEKHRFHSKGE